MKTKDLFPNTQEEIKKTRANILMATIDFLRDMGAKQYADYIVEQMKSSEKYVVTIQAIILTAQAEVLKRIENK